MIYTWNPKGGKFIDGGDFLDQHGHPTLNISLGDVIKFTDGKTVMLTRASMAIRTGDLPTFEGDMSKHATMQFYYDRGEYRILTIHGPQNW